MKFAAIVFSVFVASSLVGQNEEPIIEGAFGAQFGKPVPGNLFTQLPEIDEDGFLTYYLKLEKEPIKDALYVAKAAPTSKKVFEIYADKALLDSETAHEIIKFLNLAIQKKYKLEPKEEHKEIFSFKFREFHYKDNASERTIEIFGNVGVSASVNIRYQDAKLKKQAKKEVLELRMQSIDDVGL